MNWKQVGMASDTPRWRDFNEINMRGKVQQLLENENSAHKVGNLGLSANIMAFLSYTEN